MENAAGNEIGSTSSSSHTGVTTCHFESSGNFGSYLSRLSPAQSIASIFAKGVRNISKQSRPQLAAGRWCSQLSDAFRFSTLCSGSAVSYTGCLDTRHSRFGSIDFPALPSSTLCYSLALRLSSYVLALWIPLDSAVLHFSSYLALLDHLGLPDLLVDYLEGRVLAGPLFYTLFPLGSYRIRQKTLAMLILAGHSFLGLWFDEYLFILRHGVLLFSGFSCSNPRSCLIFSFAGVVFCLRDRVKIPESIHRTECRRGR